MWFQDTEGAKFWMHVLGELKRRGVRDILICCVDGLTGFPEAIEAVFPLTTVQTCVVHLIRRSLRYVPRRELEKVAKDLKPIYTAVDADAAWQALEAFDAKWGERFPPVVQAWQDAWEHFTPFLRFTDEVRRVVYTTDESVNPRIGCERSRAGVRPLAGRGRPPSEAQVLGLRPAAQLAPLRAFSVASHWRRPRPPSVLAGLGLPVGDLLAVGVLGLLGELALAAADLFEGVVRRPCLSGRGGTASRRAARARGASCRSATGGRTRSPRRVRSSCQHSTASLRAVATTAICIPRRARTR